MAEAHDKRGHLEGSAVGGCPHYVQGPEIYPLGVEESSGPVVSNSETGGRLEAGVERAVLVGRCRDELGGWVEVAAQEAVQVAGEPLQGQHAHYPDFLGLVV